MIATVTLDGAHFCGLHVLKNKIARVSTVFSRPQVVATWSGARLTWHTID
jgi:hypothetical protein